MCQNVRRFLFIGLTILLGCRDSAFQAAARSNTIESYRQFVAQHPRDPDRDVAQARLEELSFLQAQKVHTVVAYKRFLEEFPSASQVAAAEKLLETLRFNAVSASPTITGLRQFLREHREGAHRDEAEAILTKLELDELKSSHDSQRLAELVKKFPDEPQAERAAAQIDEAAWSRANDASALYAYLREFPSGAHRDEAKTRLLSLQVEGLLSSGAIKEARAAVSGSALAGALKDLPERFARAEKLLALQKSKDQRIAQVFAAHSLRSLDDLVRSFSAPDPLDRWQAVEEVGWVVSVQSIDPLLEHIRTGRSVLARQRAFESLGLVLRALPRRVSEYEVVTRLERLQVQANDAQVLLSIAVLFDLTGQLERASREYQRMFDVSSPDPIVLRRWVDIRRERRQYFSAAVVARQLSAWAKMSIEAAPEPGPHSALWTSRDLCGALEMARFAENALSELAKEQTEFPDDVALFLRQARQTSGLAQAKLRDAELALLGTNPTVRTCGDDQVRARMKDGEKRRLDSIAALKQRPPKELPLLMEAIQQTDPSMAVRDAATALTKK